MSESDNLFELLTKWSRRKEKDPLENRLTAVLVAIATKTPALQQELAELAGVELGAGETSGSIRMHPSAFDAQQRYCGQPDFELRIGGVTVWWEAKLDSPESGDDQLIKYERCLPQGPLNALVVLAPARRRQELTMLFRKERMQFVSWEQVLSRVQDRSNAADEQDRRLLQEALKFFHVHGLDPTPPVLSTKLVNVLKAASGAEAALEETLEAVDDRIQVEYGQPTIHGLDHEYRPGASSVKPAGWGEYGSSCLVVRIDRGQPLGWAVLRAERSPVQVRQSAGLAGGTEAA